MTASRQCHSCKRPFTQHGALFLMRNGCIVPFCDGCIFDAEQDTYLFLTALE